ncbi:UspA domain protein (plasmid) [Natrialba magadii ATCC 43099]|uniref:UspA domain protein n=1 Tax=Natrialba magadii (strain ATCC 43099 / DSM 3394 / CCM 3739 / CIP 104546 / IAM 13178 / JCM 8861 / NBRC 102185 / NCIMB 2190 / MS3) TaxID=547559 RepID=D3T155_NATMM|nr:universal stress protein [Natrialba magadii]ADD07314.1 UspA domain protein [Natrialba magadii ATCC 43099]ELY32696.1 UspA domain-containing protein [Natrialba magadii ATCC 43099]
MYDTILIPTDGSKGTERAIANGLDIAQQYDATVHALYVIDTAELLEVGYVGNRSDFEATIEPLEDEAKQAVGDIRERAQQHDVDVITLVREGVPYETIMEYVDESGADLIVMGTHGHRGLPRYLLGSVTERVVRMADVPVLTVRMHDCDSNN